MDEVKEPVLGGSPEEGKQAEFVSAEDFGKLQSLYDKRFAEAMTTIKGLETQLAETKAEAATIKAGLPQDHTEFLARETRVKQAEALVKVQQGDLAAARLDLAATRLALEARALGVEIPKEDLLKLGNESNMELAVLRLAVKPKAKVPPSTVVTKPGGTGPTPTGDLLADSGLQLEQYLRRK